ncbi:MAG: histidine--tRNA ligase [Candidatus Glassbacteria bacterium]|nr:histidine--tRNA ligase [Candidatus Glassbacteria bacterium]
MKYRVPRGTQDILPPESSVWRGVEEVARVLLERFGYSEIRTPVFEMKDLFLRTVGEETDIVQKEMYTFADRKGRELALRPEGTAPVIRSYVENSLWKDNRFLKLYYMGPMFRYDRPQKGRYRQFHQIGAEAVGSLSPAVDAEVIAMVEMILRAAGIRRLTVRINSLGEAESRANYTSALKDYFGAVRDRLCSDCNTRLERNPMRLLDCKVPSCRELAADIPPIEDYLSPESSEHYAQVQEKLAQLGVNYEKDKHMVRGLDYYTRTTFEFYHGELGGSVALGGGGRYDSLVEEIGGPDTPAIGFSLGTERVLLAAERDRQSARDVPRDRSMIYLAWIGEKAGEAAFRLAAALRLAVRVELELESRSLKAQFRQADKLGAGYVMIIGERELAEGKVQLKDLTSGGQRELTLAGLAEFIEQEIKSHRMDESPHGRIDRILGGQLDEALASLQF